MASTLICDGTTIRIELGKLSWAAFRALPVFCCAFYSFLAAIMGVKDLIAVTDHGIGDYFSGFLFLFLGLAFSVPGLMIVSRRLFVIDKVRGEATASSKLARSNGAAAESSPISTLSGLIGNRTAMMEAAPSLCVFPAVRGQPPCASIVSNRPSRRTVWRGSWAAPWTFHSGMHQLGSVNGLGDLELKNRGIGARTLLLKTPATETVSGSLGGATAVG